MNRKNTKSHDKLILITGGAGYVGVILTETLLRKGFKVRIFDKFYFGEKPISHLSKKIEIVKGDIRKAPLKIFKDVFAVIHLAGLSNDPTADFNPHANNEINTLATKNLAIKAKKSGVKRFIFASSCSIYDLGLDKESGMKNEESHVEPVAYYSRSKYLAEKELLKLSSDNFCIVILRKGTVCGFSPRMRYDLVVNTMLKNALSSGKIKVFCKGTQWRPLIDVEDVAQAYYKTLIAPEQVVNGQIFNFTSYNFLIRELADVIQRALKKQLSRNIDIIFEQDDKKDRSYRVSNEKAKKLLKFEPKVSMEKSISKMLRKITTKKYNNYDHPIYYNINWMRPFLEKEEVK